MKDRFYNPTLVQKDELFCSIMRELHNIPDVFIVSEPEKVLVHHMVQNRSGDYERTGEKHVGYDRHYTTFEYQGFLFYIQSSTYFPFTDENYPGLFNFLAYRRIGKTKKEQVSYFEEYKDFSSIADWLKLNKPRHIQDAPQNWIDVFISEGQANQIARAVSSKGGVREKTVLHSNPLFLSTETWNDEHKVIRVVSGKSEEDGHRDTFEFDFVSSMICG